MKSGELSSEAAARWLLVDNSNSFTKLGLCTAEALLDRRSVRTSEVTEGTLREAVAGWEFGRVILSSVVPALAPVFRGLADGGRDFLLLDWRTRIGAGIEYPKPESIGGDRLANVAAAVHFYGRPCVVVDFGTAVTFDVISAEGNYVGGVIAPGLEAMTHYLHQRTALLPRIELDEPAAAVGKSTREAMLSGAVHGYRGLVEGILREIAREMGAEPEVVATGGYAELIARRVPAIRSVHPDLTLEGLRMVGRLNPEAR